MILKEKISTEVLKHFSKKGLFKREELYDFLEDKFYSDLKPTTFRWRIHELKKQNILFSPKRGWLKIVQKKVEYKPDINDFTTLMVSHIKDDFLDINSCVWSSNWFNQFSKHQAFFNIIFIEIEKELMYSVFYNLIDRNIDNLYIKPNDNIVEDYIQQRDEAIIIKPLITKSPLQEINGINTPKLEKIMVDLFADSQYLLPYQGVEKKIIYNNILSEYEINLSALFNYSKRRKKESRVLDFLYKNDNIPGKLLDDT